MFLLIIIQGIFAVVLSQKLFLIGGGTSKYSAQVYQQLARTVPGRPAQPSNCDQNWEATKCPRIAVATSASSSQQEADIDYYIDTQGRLGCRSLFLLYGMAPQHITVHRDNYKIHGNISTPEGQANLQILQQADIIFFNGGDQSYHIRAWLNDGGSPSPLFSALKQKIDRSQIVLSGSSAGSMIWSRQIYGGGDPFGVLYFANSVGLAPKKVTDAQSGEQCLVDTRNGTESLQYKHNGAKLPGFDLIDFIVDTHFEAYGRIGRLPAVAADLRVQLGVGIDQNTVLYYVDGIGKVFGYNGVTICDMSNAILQQNEYFTANGIRASYLTAGDIYDFKTQEVSSSKPEIKIPAYNQPTDSSNILAPYQASLLSKRLVDQRAVYNLGSTQTPPDFSQSTPKFQIKFYKDFKSKGYLTDNKYTVEKILYSYSYGANFEGQSSK